MTQVVAVVSHENRLLPFLAMHDMVADDVIPAANWLSVNLN